MDDRCEINDEERSQLSRGHLFRRDQARNARDEISNKIASGMFHSYLPRAVSRENETADKLSFAFAISLNVKLQPIFKS